MRQAVMTAPAKIEFNDVPEPTCGAGEILLRIRRIGICGSDIHVCHGKHPFTSYPVVQGHEYCGTVEQVGEGVENVSVGAKATARPQLVCGQCRPCLRGDYNICDNLRVQGFQAPGVAQDLFVTTADRIVPLPDDMSYEEGAMVEPVSVAVHSTSKGGDLSGKNVAVLGAGTIGNLIAQVVKSRGAKKVLITDLSDYRLDIARKCGIEDVANVSSEDFADVSKRVFGDEGFDIAYEAAGAEASLDDAVQNIQKGGTIVAVGVFEGIPKVDMSTMGDRELKFIGTLMYKHEDYLQAVELIHSGKVETDTLITKHFPFEEFPRAYEFIEQSKDKTMKVMIDM